MIIKLTTPSHKEGLSGQLVADVALQLMWERGRWP